MAQNKCTGTEASYVRGCRCDDCKQARSVAVKRRTHDKRQAERAASPANIVIDKSKPFRLPPRDSFQDCITREQYLRYN